MSAQSQQEREEGHLLGYPSCCIEHYVELRQQGRWPGWEMGEIYAGEREQEVLVGQGTDIRWVPCPHHRDHPPEGTVFEPPTQDRATVLSDPSVVKLLQRQPDLARRYGITLPNDK